ncbi:beta-glucosidase [Desertihabitans brevis]|uniref:Beta-glucosidase n=1 Tax=Desertihabitans brevis TaxID=2268447 RepID=A0A367YUU8_9ACTN|nr:glycoside hydrolase family 3 protein [Desertihabitans brevis]RCK69665.1 beta-glucosidase [Desertihabitans brevis]
MPQDWSPRVRELLGSLSTEQKVAMLHQHQPALPEHGLADFHTGQEALHGVAWIGEATVFPQAVGLGASWDADLLERVGAVVGTELRAHHAKDPAVGLNAWAPVVNPLRHPGWGRNEEGLSEDPHLTAELATGYARGLRGDDERVWRCVPTLKHLSAYNVEDHRDVLSVQVPPRVLHEYELPAFLGPARAGVVGAVMPSYNLVNGRPAHLDAEAIEAVREAADGLLAVVSDAYAPGNVASVQLPGLDPAGAYGLVLRAGVDSFTQDAADPGPTRRHLTEALERGVITVADVDAAVGRLLTLRERTGELDPSTDPYASIGPDQIDLPEHRALAREVAGRSVVVLTNPTVLSRSEGENATPDRVLPLPPDASVAVVGPLADRVLTDWYSGTPPYAVSVADAFAERGPTRTADGLDRVVLRVQGTPGWLGVDEHARVRAGERSAATAWALQDWGDGLLTLDSGRGLMGSRDGRTVDVHATRVGGWEVQESFATQVHADGSWSLLHLGTRRWLWSRPDGVIEAGAARIGQAARFEVTTVASGTAEAVRLARESDVAVVVVGNDPHLNGRETADRPSLELPPAQAELVRSVAAVQPRAVVVVVSSYPYVLDDDLAALPLVWTSHGGQELGHGVVDVLTGAVEPSGRLPQPWPLRPSDCGGITDYDLESARQTSWWSPHAPRFALGHGLHFGDVRYGTVTASVVGDEVALEVALVNHGARTAPELVQVYHRVEVPGREGPRRLVAHTRVELAPGEERTVTLRVPRERLTLWDVTADRFWLPGGEHRFEVGASAADVRSRATVELAGDEAPCHRPARRPVRAECWSWCEGLELAPREVLSGSVLRPVAGGGRAGYGPVDVDGLDAVRLVLRRRGPGRVEVAAAWVGGSEVSVGAEGDGLPEVVLPRPGQVGQPAELEVALSGPVELVEISAVGGAR